VIRVRYAELSDIDEIISIAIDSFKDEFSNYDEAWRTYNTLVRSRWEDIIKDRSALNFAMVAEHEGKVVGFLVFRWWFGWNGWLEALAVKKDFRGRGIGTQLLNALIERVKSYGYRRVCMALEREDLVRFYNRFKAYKVGELPDEELGKLPIYCIDV